MPVYISMLRGVNVGGNNKIAMSELKALYASLKLRDPQTFIQSGNVLFATAEKSPDKLAKSIQGAIERKFQIKPEVILRTSAEMRQAMAANPFSKRQGLDPGKLLVTFLPVEVDAETREKLLALKTAPDELQIRGREVFIYFPDGAGRSKSWPVIERTLKKAGTSRNWNSVTKMLELAEKMESAGK